MEESGCALEHSNAAKFRSHVIEGEWDQVSGSVDTTMHVHMFPWQLTNTDYKLEYTYNNYLRIFVSLYVRILMYIVFLCLLLNEGEDVAH